VSAGLIGVRLWKNVGAKVRELWFGGRCGMAVRRLGPSFLIMRVKKGAWGFWGSFGLRAAHGQGKYALAVPAATTEFRKSARQLPSGNFAR